MNKQQAIEIIEREPVGGAQFYELEKGKFYSRYGCDLYVYNLDGWDLHTTDAAITVLPLKPMHEILEIALGEG